MAAHPKLRVHVGPRRRQLRRRFSAGCPRRGPREPAEQQPLELGIAEGKRGVLVRAELLQPAAVQRHELHDVRAWRRAELEAAAVLRQGGGEAQRHRGLVEELDQREVHLRRNCLARQQITAVRIAAIAASSTLDAM